MSLFLKAVWVGRNPAYATLCRWVLLSHPQERQPTVWGQAQHFHVHQPPSPLSPVSAAQGDPAQRTQQFCKARRQQFLPNTRSRS